MRGKGDFGGNRGGNTNGTGRGGGYQGRRNFNGRMNTNQGHNRQFKTNTKPFIPHVSFDLIQVEQTFPRVKPVKPEEETTFNEALVKRNLDLTPAATELENLLNLVTRVQTILDTLLITPGDFESCQLEEVKQVGSFKNETLLLSNRLDADICVVLKTLPTREAVSSLGNKVFEELKLVASSPAELETFKLNMNDSGFELVSKALVGLSVNIGVQVYVTTQQQNIRKLEANLHLDYKICQQSLNSIKHAKWFEENTANEASIKHLVRLLKDLQSRFDGLQALSPWMLELLAWYSTMNNPKREALPLAVAFKRIFQLIAAGFFLPGSAGIIDPCENQPSRVHTHMTLDQQDVVCYTFQTLLRVFAHGGFRQILGLEGNTAIATIPSVWAGVVIIPSSRAYEPSKEIEQIEEPKEEETQISNGTTVVEAVAVVDATPAVEEEKVKMEVN